MLPSRTQNLLCSALTHHRSGRLDDAEKGYRAVLAEDADNPDALHLLGVVIGESGRREAAIELIERAIAIEDNLARYHNDLANLLTECGDLERAISCYQRAITLDPKCPSILNNLGTALRDGGQTEQAIESYHRALQLDPALAEAHCNLGVALADCGKLDEAIAKFERAIQLKGSYADAWTNLGVTLYAHRRGQEAVVACRKAVELNPGLAKAHSNLGLILLGTGHFREGWDEHEWRLRSNPQFTPRSFAQPCWDGTELNGRTVLLYCEQGFGDTIQFARYAALTAEMGGTVLLESPPELASLLESVSPNVRVIPSGEPLPAFDVHRSLMSLPFVFSRAIDFIPSAVPYLRANETLVGTWRCRLGPKRSMRVGLAWAGRPTHSNDFNRSIPPSQLATLSKLRGVEFHSLQRTDLSKSNIPIPVIDHHENLHDFADTAALIANLDRVISVDTAVAHLAGAMGKTAWLLLPYAADWRWMISRDDSPWYPTMRLFRQSRWGDWEGLINNLPAVPHA